MRTQHVSAPGEQRLELSSGETYDQSIAQDIQVSSSIVLNGSH
jgi:hypothetical protein